MNRYPLFFLLLFYGSLVFSQHTVLNSWHFYTEKNPVPKTVHLPHTWNAQDAFDDKSGYWQGTGYYRTDVEIEDLSKAYFLKFDGVNQITKVFVNGKYVGTHKGGYTAFQFEISKFLKQGENQVKVEVNNERNEEIPPLSADFTFYGGMYRKVYLVKENQTHFAKKYGADVVKITPTLTDAKNGQVEIETGVHHPSANLSLNVTLKDANGKKVYHSDQFWKKDKPINFEIKKPQLWSPKAPHLYHIEIQLKNPDGKVLDTYTCAIGFREFKASSKGFILNGKPLKLIGANLHQDRKGLGNAVPVEKQVEDMKAIKTMGANFLRLAHYPHDPKVYEAADSLGIILWSEIPVVNKVPANKSYAGFEQNALQMQHEHIAQNYNHPSLLFVGYMNEIFLRLDFDKNKGKEKQAIVDHTLKLAKKLEKLTRKLAPHRLTVMAIHHNQIYNKTGIADIPMVLGWNLYFGWYGGKIDDLAGFLDKEHQKYPKRPIIISEYGVGADTRLHSEHPKKMDFTEEYQLAFHQGYLKQVGNRDFVIGMTAWNFADFGSEGRGDAIPHVNQKGLVNFDRTPKNIYYWYEAELRPKKEILRFYQELPVWINNSNKKEVKVIANRKAMVELNGKKIDKKTPKEGTATFKLHLKEGKNTLRLYDGSGELKDSLNLRWEKPDFKDEKIVAINFGRDDFFTDNSDQVWIPRKVMDKMKISNGAKTVTSSTNIWNTKNDPLYQSALTNVKNIRIQLPKGKYKISLYFANLGSDKTSAYELSKKAEKRQSSEGTINLRINNKSLQVKGVSKFHKKVLQLTVFVKNKLEIAGKENTNFYINAIKIKKLD